MTLSFFNGPVQNGDFTFSGKPGKAVGIRIAEALNRILGFPPVPQLWNTVRLAGDLRYRRHTATAAAPIPRPDFEAALIAAKYDTGWHPAGGTATDADDAVERRTRRSAPGAAHVLPASRRNRRRRTGSGHP